MIAHSPASDGGLPAFLASRARRMSDGALAIVALLGSAGAIAAFMSRGALWPAIAAVPVCVAAFGFWGILDRELTERPEVPQRMRTLMRVLQLSFAILGFAAGATVLMIAVASTLGRIIS